eukprot:m.169680 g.169680  ORF g.169680 m.169680 type:complete len:334 (-) comp31581_c0_seq2:374-1375(-)
MEKRGTPKNGRPSIPKVQIRSKSSAVNTLNIKSPVIIIAVIIVVAAFMLTQLLPSTQDAEVDKSDAGTSAKRSSIIFASANESVVGGRQWVQIPCARKSVKPQHKGCAPTQCGRFVVDDAFDEADVSKLAAFAKNLMALGGGSGGPTILDLHSGALSLGDNFIDVYQMAASTPSELYDASDFAVYNTLKDSIKQAIMDTEGFDITAPLYLTKPTFFSKITNKPAKSEHDEYWHSHVDKITYSTFDYTCLLYLTTYGQDFMGGEFVFTDKTSHTVVQPRKGRLSCFSSGSENPHHITKVVSGERLAITVAFSCNSKSAIVSPDGKHATTSAAIP